jgi:hypothetical protein
MSSVVSSLQVEDPSQLGIFNKGLVLRNQNYKLMDSQYTYVIRDPHGLINRLRFSISSFTIGDNVTALLHFAVILDPLSEQAQRYTSLFEVFRVPMTILSLTEDFSHIVAVTHFNYYRGISLAAIGVSGSALPVLTPVHVLYLLHCRSHLSVSTVTISSLRSHLMRPGKQILLELLHTS